MFDKLYEVDESGQYYINFLALEILTSNEFAGAIAINLDLGYTVLEVRPVHEFVHIFLVNKMQDTVKIYRFNKATKKYATSFVTKWDFEVIKSLFEKEVNSVG